MMAGSPGEVKPASSMAPEHPVARGGGWGGLGEWYLPPHSEFLRSTSTSVLFLLSQSCMVC